MSPLQLSKSANCLDNFYQTSSQKSSKIFSPAAQVPAAQALPPEKKRAADAPHSGRDLIADPAPLTHPAAPTDQYHVGRYGLGTRLAMVVVGAVWAAAGAAWLWLALGVAPGPLERNTSGLLVIPLALLAAGMLLVKTGVTRDRPKSFEDEIPDAHPHLEDNITADWDLDDGPPTADV